MRINDKKVFLDKEKLYQMINLRLNGIAVSSLALFFNVDRSSISYQCDKYLIEPNDEVYTLERIISKVLPKPDLTFKVINGERINLGRSYKEYLTA